MEVLDVTATLGEIDFLPATELKEILQNVRTILTTVKASVPLDRGFGINADIVDKPVNYAQAQLTAEIIEVVERYEPRVRVSKVTFEGNGADGQLIPKVKVVIR